MSGSSSRASVQREQAVRLFVYWALFAVFATGALANAGPSTDVRRPSLGLALGCALIALLIGFRYHVGGDWNQYEQLFSFAKLSDAGRMLRIGDPGYQFANWAFAQSGLDFWSINLFCGVVFSYGLYQFVRTQPYPYLCILISVPYLVIVVAMGYARQGVAIGVILAGLASLLRGASVVRFAIYVAIAALFHKTAVVALPLVTLVAGRSKWLGTLLVLSSSVLLYDAFLSDAQDGFVRNYIEAEYNSQGAAVRVAMVVLPALLFFLQGKKMAISALEKSLWRNFSIAGLVLLGALFILPSSTVVDRLALYILPLQLAIIPRIATLGLGKGAGVILAVAYAFLVQFVWLNFAAHADHWVPYQFFPLLV